jgi:rod shape-determining protein MreD
MNYASSAGKLEVYMRLCVPHMVTLVFLLLNVSAFTFPFARAMKPDFLLIAVYYWAIYRPTLMPPAAIFLLGITFDFLSGSPAGFYALTYVTAHWLTRNQRRFLMSQPFITLWLGFAFVALIAGLMQWGIFAVAEMTLPDIMPLCILFGASVFLFPLIVLLLFLIHRILPGMPQELFR